jgi:Protein of unknown function (DUF1326)
MTRWEIRGREFGNCNCSYGCPCQFNALPTYGHCRGLAVFEIDEGFHGTTRLDGLRAAAIFRWPGPIHQGEGVQIIDKTRNARAARGPASYPPGRGHRTWSDCVPGLLVDLRDAARADLRRHRFRARCRWPNGARPRRRRVGNARRAHPESGHRRGAPRAHRAAKRLRVCDGRDRARLVEDGRPGQLRARRHLRPVCPDPSLPERHGTLSA